MAEPSEANAAKRRWHGGRIALGLVLFGAGVFVLIDISLVATISTILIGVVAVLTGVFEVIHAFLMPTWRGFAGRVIGGVLYVAFGILLARHTEFSVAFLTLALSAALVLSGIVRLIIGLRNGAAYRWLLLSGFVGIAAGLAIFLVENDDRTRFIALVFGADLLVHGIGWLVAATTREHPATA